MHEVEAPRQGVERCDRLCREAVAGAACHERLGDEIVPQHFRHVATQAGGEQGPGHGRQAFLFFSRRAARGAPGDQALQLAPRFEHQQLLLLVDLRDADAVAPHDHHHVVIGKPLHRLAHRCAADIQHLAQRRLGPQAARRQLQGDDQFLESAERLFRQAGVAPGGGNSGLGSLCFGHAVRCGRRRCATPGWGRCSVVADRQGGGFWRTVNRDRA